MENSFDPCILKKLRLDERHKILVVNSPEGYLSLFSNVKPDTSYQLSEAGNYDFVQVFGASQRELENYLKQVKNAGKYDCLLWACYPKGSSILRSDLKRESVWALLELIGLRPVSQIALDETWSALRGRPHEKVKSKNHRF